MAEALEMRVPNLDIRNCDCMDLMAEFPNKYFDLAIVDKTGMAFTTDGGSCDTVYQAIFYRDLT